MTIGDGVHVEHVLDNTDHNVHTLDGHHTVHCLRGIAIYTPEQDVSYHGHIPKYNATGSATST